MVDPHWASRKQKTARGRPSDATAKPSISKQALTFRSPSYFSKGSDQFIGELTALDLGRAVHQPCWPIASHAYVLMTNHVHLLVPPHSACAISWMMQMLGRRYVGSFNARYDRSGTLWEGRYKSCLVDSYSYLLRCHRYIELNPIRARMVAAPGDYRGSSYRHNALNTLDRLITPHAGFLAFGRDSQSRAQAYVDFVAETVLQEELLEIRSYLTQGWAWGSQRFQAHIEALHGRCVRIRARGRPSQST